LNLNLKSKSGSSQEGVPAIGGRKLRVAVLSGGIGPEREISLESGRYVREGLLEAGVDVRLSDVAPERLGVLEEAGVDVFFLALHGPFGEDGGLQAVLERKGLCYTGSDSVASRLAFDKMAAKEVFARAGVATPAAVEYNQESSLEGLSDMGTRFVVKPVCCGSSIGVSLVDGAAEAARAAVEIRRNQGRSMVEAFIEGREITAAVFAGRVFPLLEVVSNGVFYDYNAKYLDGGTRYLFDTVSDPAVRGRVESAALACYRALDCKSFARVDFILDPSGVPWALEVNTIPGLTGHSLVPMSAARAGWSMSRFCMEVVSEALCLWSSSAR
jgi:D-alanine-D-alanine ligase